MKLKVIYGTLLLCFLISTAVYSQAQTYDLVILNGRVMDPETMHDAVKNVGIKDGMILKITKEDIKGTETIDASGLVVAPGFIDSHDHSMDIFAAKLGVRDGLTTGIDLEIGGLNVGKWYSGKKDKWPINYGLAVSYEFTREVVLDGLNIDDGVSATSLARLRNESSKDGVNGWSDVTSSTEQINQITKILDENFQQGALGLGNTVGYMRKGVSTYELWECMKLTARWGRVTSTHTRFHSNTKTPTEAGLGFDEVFTNAFLLGAPLLIAHDNDYGWWEIEEKLQLARAKGLNMWAEYYPYAAGSTSIGSGFVKPENWLDVNGYKYEETLFDPTQNKFLTLEEYKDVVAKDPGRVVVLYVPPRKEWIKYWPKIPHMVVAGDNTMGTDDKGEYLKWEDDFTKYAGHPRTAGSRGKVLRMGRELDIPLMFTLHQLTYWTAKHLGDAGIEAMKVRGRMQEGMVADITIFNAETVTDNATYKNGEQGLPTSGIPYVIVYGNIVVRDSKVQDVFKGQPIRYKVDNVSRWEEATQKQWLESHSFDFGFGNRQLEKSANTVTN